MVRRAPLSITHTDLKKWWMHSPKTWRQARIKEPRRSVQITRWRSKWILRVNWRSKSHSAWQLHPRAMVPTIMEQLKPPRTVTIIIAAFSVTHSPYWQISFSKMSPKFSWHHRTWVISRILNYQRRAWKTRAQTDQAPLSLSNNNLNFKMDSARWTLVSRPPCSSHSPWRPPPSSRPRAHKRC